MSTMLRQISTGTPPPKTKDYFIKPICDPESWKELERTERSRFSGTKICWQNGALLLIVVILYFIIILVLNFSTIAGTMAVPVSSARSSWIISSCLVVLFVASCSGKLFPWLPINQLSSINICTKFEFFMKLYTRTSYFSFHKMVMNYLWKQ